MRKLVQLNGEYGGWLEIDPVKLKRVATIFREWLLKLDSGSDEFGFLQQDLPIVEGVLNGSITLPFKGIRPHSRELGEGLLPRSYTEVSAPFYNTIRGNLDSPPQVIMKDGKYYAWVEFENSDED